MTLPPRSGFEPHRSLDRVPYTRRPAGRPLTERCDFQVAHLYIRLASARLPYKRKGDEEEEEVESAWNPAKLLRHCNGIDLKGRLTGNFRGARDSSWSLFVSFLGFGFGFGRFLLHGR